MNRALLATLLGTVLLLTGGCKKTDNNEAIRAGVIKHLSSVNGLNVNNMDIVVTQASISGDKAQANVDIRAKNGDPTSPAMQLVYQLEKQGAEWVVVKGQSTGGMQHPSAGDTPQGNNLPPGHPSVGGADSQLPASHSDFNAILNSAQPQQNQQQPSSPQPATQKPSSSSAKP